MADVIRLRRGTAAQWDAVDPVLRAGEPGFETDSGKHKIGDGERAWSALPYFLDEPALERWHEGLDPAVVTPGAGGLVVYVTDQTYGATGDGSTDDTAAIQAAIDATPSGGVCWFPPGTYLVQSAGASILTARDGITLAGAGPTLAVLRTGAGSQATRVLSVSQRTDVTVRDLGFDGASHATTRSGVYASTRGTLKNLTVSGCRFADFMPGDTTTTHAAVYTWTSQGVRVVDNEFVGCGRAVTIDQPDGSATVAGNRISASTGVMATGVLVRRASSSSEGQVQVHGNVVSGADLDPGGVGAEGHGIAVYRCRDVQVTHNHLAACGRGVLVSYLSFGAVVQGNTCVRNADAGIRCEPEISSTTTTVGTDVPRGVTVVGNVCRDNRNVGEIRGANTGLGITLSYAAGSVVSGNLCHDNTGDGIHCDSDRVSIVGNVVFNNFRGYTPTNGRRAGIRLYAGVGCTVVGNQAFDNQSTPTQDYGLSISSGGAVHVVHGNNFTGNGVGEVYGADRIRDSFFGVTPTSRRPDPGTATGLNNTQVLNDVVAGLRALGLFDEA